MMIEIAAHMAKKKGSNGMKNISNQQKIHDTYYLPIYTLTRGG